MPLPRQRVWDLPTRIFHWSLAAGTIAAFLTGEDVRKGDVHAWLGASIGLLLAFRLTWGFVGERWSRWSAFPLRRPPAGHAPADADAPGHPRTGAWSAVLVLVLLGAIVLTGALVLGGEEGRGPLAGVVSPAIGLDVHALHRVAAWVLPAWLVAHVAGVVLHGRRTRAPVIRAMVDGKKPGTHAPVAPRAGVAVALLLGLGASALLAFVPARAPIAPLATNPAWDDECGACHLAFSPSLLPARSWERMLAEQADHFGEDLALPPDTVAALRAFADANAAEAGASEHAVRTARAIPADQAPLQITATPLWKSVHASLSDADFADPNVGGRIRCTACHPDAEAGTFEGPAVTFPPPLRR